MDYNAYFLISFPVPCGQHPQNRIKTENLPIQIGKLVNPMPHTFR